MRAEQIIDDGVGKDRHQPHEGDELPAIGLDAADDLLQARPGAALDPVAGDIARDQERGRGAERGAGKINEAAPDRSEQNAADDVENAAGDHGDGGGRIKQDETDRGPVAKAGNAGLHAGDAGRAVEDPVQRQTAGHDQQDDQRDEPSSLRHAAWEGLPL